LKLGRNSKGQIIVKSISRNGRYLKEQGLEINDEILMIQKYKLRELNHQKQDIILKKFKVPATFAFRKQMGVTFFFFL
jgi:hypothetical protein